MQFSKAKNVSTGGRIDSALSTIEDIGLQQDHKDIQELYDLEKEVHTLNMLSNREKLLLIEAITLLRNTKEIQYAAKAYK